MEKSLVYRLKVRTPDDPAFSAVARMVNPPAIDPEKTRFVPAYAGFNIGEGADVDISYFHEPPSAAPWRRPRSGFDRHLRSEELWVVVEGDFYLPLGLCRYPDDPEDVPHPDDMLCFTFREGDLFVLRPNVWHCGPWPVRPGISVRFYMLLSGHRKAASGQNVDHITRRFPGDVAILPDVDEDGRPR